MGGVFQRLCPWSLTIYQIIPLKAHLKYIILVLFLHLCGILM